MIIYQATKSQFCTDVLDNRIDQKVYDAVYSKLGRATPANELRSWQNSLHRMGEVLMDEGIPNDAGVAVEYNLPYTCKRVDMIVSGYGEDDRGSAVIIELKQWEEAVVVPGKDSVVKTYLNGNIRETAHPSYQAWSYACAIRDFNASVQDDGCVLAPCAYLHNYAPIPDDPFLSDGNCVCLPESPVFLKYDASRLREFLKKYLHRGDSCETIFKIDGGRLRPSKSLQDSLSRMLKGNREFVMLDEQKLVYETVMRTFTYVTTHEHEKKTIVVRGGPGTGKSVLAINLLVDICKNNRACAYVTKNAAPRNVYKVKLKGSEKRSTIDEMFKSSCSFIDCDPDTFDVLLVDEAHRLNDKSGMFRNLGENQIKEIINSSKLSVFFLDEDQRVVLNDIGSLEEIRKWAKQLGSSVHIMDLESQFRCNGSDGYLAWLDDVLDIRHTANFDNIENPEYDIRVYDDPNELRREIERLNTERNKARIVAGYCWNWISEGKNDSNVHDIVIPDTGFEMSWNLGDSSTWAIDSNSVKEAGCIHTCQGLEFDYVGVIIGDDLYFDGGSVRTDYTKRAKTDASLKGLKRKYPDVNEAGFVADRIIRNTYRTLMSRGMKGCFVYCTSKALNEYLKKRVGSLLRTTY